MNIKYLSNEGHFVRETFFMTNAIKEKIESLETSETLDLQES